MSQPLFYNSKLEDAYLLLQEGRLDVCIKTCGSLLESSFRHLYEKLMLHFTVPQRIEIMRIEEDITKGKGLQRAGLGQFYGVFEKAGLFKTLAKKNNVTTQSLASLDFSNLIDLRNRVTHQGYIPDLAESSLCFFTVYQFLKVTFEITWEPLLLKPSLPNQSFCPTPQDSYRYLLEIVWQKGHMTSGEADYLKQKAHAFDLRYQEVEQLEQSVKNSYEEPVVVEDPTLPYAFNQGKPLSLPNHLLPAERYQIFFQAVLDGLKQKSHRTKAEKAQPKSALNLGAGYGGFQMCVSFARNSCLRVELYIDTGERKANKKAFEWFCQAKEELEMSLGTLEWERLDSRRASRIAWYAPGSIQDDEQTLAKLRDLAIQRLLLFFKAFSPLLERYHSRPAEVNDSADMQRWQARTGQQVLDHLQSVYQLLQTHMGPLELNLSNQNCFKLLACGSEWLHLWPRKKGFTLYLADTGSKAGLPSDHYDGLLETFESENITTRWQDGYDNGLHPIHCVMDYEDFERTVLLDELKRNYDTFCRNQSG